MSRPTRPTRRAWVAASGVLVLLWFGAAPAADAAPQDKVDLIDASSGEPVTGGFSMLDRAEDGIATKIRTRDVGGHAYTLWYAIFNAPQHCSGGVCGEDDVFAFDPGNPDFPFNRPQIEATRLSVLWAKAGAVANPAGRLSLEGGLSVGEIPDGPGQVVIGRSEDGALVALGVAAGLEDPNGAEIHVILQDHGTAHTDERLMEQLTSFRGACNPDCSEPQFGVHQP